MKLKVSKEEAAIIKEALEARVIVMGSIARRIRTAAQLEDQVGATRALLKRLFIKELV